MKLIGYVLKMLLWIAVGRPQYRSMRDSWFTMVTFLVVANALLLATEFFFTLIPEMHGARPSFNKWLIFIYQTIATTVLMSVRGGKSSLLTTAFFGCSAIVDFAACALWVLGFRDLDLVIYFGAKILWCAFAYLAYCQQSEEVKRVGYGLQPGQF